MKKILLLLIVLLASVLTIEAQTTFTWTNADNDFDHDNLNNWTPTPAVPPSFGDNIVFDGAFTNDNLVIPYDNDYTSIRLNSNYTGTVDCGSSQVILTNLILQGGTFIAPSTVLEVSGNMTKSGSAVFVKDATGIVQYNLASTTARNITGTFDFSTLNITTSGTSGNRTINFGASTSTVQNLVYANQSYPMAYRGTVNVSSGFTVSGTSTSAAPNNTGTIVFVGAGSKTILGTSSVSQNPVCNITMNHSGALSVSGHLCTTGIWNYTNIGSYTAGTSTITMNSGTVTSGTSATTRAYFDNVTVGGTGLVLTGTSQMELKGNFTNNSSITANNSLLIFSGTGAQTIGGTSAATLNAVQISNNIGTLGIALSILDSVKISGGAVTTGGLLTLRSSSAKKARIAEISSGTLLGNITVETFALGGTTDWTVLGASGVGGLTLANWDGQIPMTCDGCTNGTTTAGGPFASAVAYDETQAGNAAYVTMSNTTPLTSGKGFWIYLGDNASTTGNMTWNVTGPAVSGNTVITGLTNSANSGYNLVANPYPSPISWARVLATNSSAPINDAIYIYNPDVTGGQTSYVGGISSHANGANNVIPMGQGFYVQVTGATSLNFQESNKISNNTASNQLLRSSEAAQVNSSIGSVIRLKVNDGFNADETAIRFHTDATTNFDKALDANKLWGSPAYINTVGEWTKRTAIATEANNNAYSINSLPYAHTQNAVIPVIVRVYATGQHTISGSDLTNLPPSACVTLKDKLLNINHDLKSGDYICNINDTTYAARFELTVCADITTDIKSQTSASNLISINKDEMGVFVNFDYVNPTDATISVTNILGQTVMNTKNVKVSNDKIYLDLSGTNDQLLFITVETANEKVTKKILKL